MALNRSTRGFVLILTLEILVLAILVILGFGAYRQYTMTMDTLLASQGNPGAAGFTPQNLQTLTAVVTFTQRPSWTPLETPVLIPTPTPTPTSIPDALIPTIPALPDEPVIYAVGDIAECLTNPGALEVSSALLDEHPEGLILALGDLSNDSGTAADYETCFNPIWGHHLSRLRAVPGNHEYDQPGAADYFAYAGDSAGPEGLGYYSFDFHGWHIVALNSNCTDAGGCEPGSPQYQWLAADLAAHPARCTLAFWHHPLHSSGRSGGTEAVRWFWQLLYAADAELILNGHDHQYERYAPMNVLGGYDPDHGLRQFIVGTGGAGLWIWRETPTSLSSRVIDYGVLQLELRESSYSWQFLTADGSVSDSGVAECH